MAELTSTNLNYLFPTPFLNYVWEDSAALNEELRRRILAHERANPGISKTNVGGWHSETGTLEWCGDAGKVLLSRMFEAANYATIRLLSDLRQRLPDAKDFSWTLQAWANVSRPGAFNKPHTHGGATWSGTYYVDTGDPPADAQDGTPLLLMDADQGRANTFMPGLVPMTCFVKPEPGLMVLFPSYLPHMVYAHRGKRPRISIAFNLRKEPFP
jgi:uncharacterized protein (TIGR02466 family)